MNYEEKYNNALERAMNLFVTNNVSALVIGEIFPELAESEDERIRKSLIKAFGTIGKRDWGGLIVRDILAWLEKQNVKPKFKVGDWIVFNGLVLYINEIVNGYYRTISIGGIPCGYDWAIDNIARLWTINDAKDGDVLMTTKTRNCPFIYRKTDYNNDLAYYYVGVDGNGGFCEGYLEKTMYHFGSVANITPATKEQRDLLLQKMKEAGYEWDSEKKELKKIEPKMLNANEVIDWLDMRLPIGEETYMIDRFKKDFEL